VLFTGLHAGTAYSFTVRTANRAGWSASSATTAPVIPGQVPTVPTLLVAGTPASGQVSLHWAAAGGAPTSYRVYRCAVLPSPAPVCAPAGAPVGAVNAPSTTFTDTGRTNQASYRYAVDAVNRWGSSPRSTVVTAMPVGPPPAPTALTATTSGSSVLLSWAPPVRTGGADLTQYVVTTDATAPVTLPATARSYAVTDLSAAVHTFTVAARSALGLGTAALAQASLLVPPPSPQVQPVIATPVVVTVSHPAPALPGAAVTLTVRVVRADTRVALASVPVTVSVIPRAGAQPAPLHVLTGATGTATVIVRPAVTSAVTAVVAASPRVRAAAGSYLLPVRGSLTARLAATTVRVAQPTAMSGSTGRLLVGERVSRQQYYAGGWHTLATALVSSTGTWRFAFTPTTVGPHLYRVVLPASGLHLAVASSTLVLGVTR
jgi:acyl dehydratase